MKFALSGSGLVSAFIGLTLLTNNVVRSALQERQLNVTPPSQESSPNPIASLYPDGITGTINSTIAIIPIPFHIARSIIPKQWGINRAAYRALLPHFPTDSYPNVHTFFPFVDLLGDGYSSFNWNKYLLISATNTIALGGATANGEVAVPATFTPDHEAYAYSDECRSKETFFNAFSPLTPPNVPTISTRFVPVQKSPWPMKFFVNVTNQPIFTNGITCDNQIFFYNTTLSTGKNSPVPVLGSISLSAPLYVNNSTFHGVYGVKVDTAFLENTGVPCANLKGYHGTGPGDR